MIYYPSANRDEDVFERAGHASTSAAQPNPHVAFGGGGHHFCLGASLARLEIKVMFEEVFRRLPGHRAGRSGARACAPNFINGIKHLPVRFTPERG